MADQGRDVYAQPLVQRIKILGNGFPGPFNPGLDRLERDCLHVREDSG